VVSSIGGRPNKRLKLAARVNCGMNSSSARRSLQAAVLIGLVTPLNAVAQARLSSGDSVWVAAGCTRGRTLRVEVRVADTTIARTDLTICRGERAKEPHVPWEFAFAPSRSVIWSNDSTAPGESIAGQIWQAGGESDALLLGVVLVAHNQILVNSIHVASPSGSASTPVDDGVVVRTMVLPPRASGPHRQS